MGDSSIEWTDKVWNPVTGCTKVSPGCKYCYAERVFPRAYGTSRKFTDVRCHYDRLDQPLHWRKPARIFVNSMSDLFHEDVPFEFIDKVFAVMALTPRHTYQVLTKRPARMREYMGPPNPASRLEANCRGMGMLWKNIPVFEWPLPNVWLGVSAEDQEHADKRITELLQTPAAMRFVSYEPALGPVEFDSGPGRAGPHRYFSVEVDHPEDRKLDWVIVGGESGPVARPFNIQWARDVIDQCRTAGVACFVKQLGALPIIPSGRQNHWDWGPAVGQEAKFEHFSDSPTMWRVRLNSRKGGDMSEWPSDLRVREFPR